MIRRHSSPPIRPRSRMDILRYFLSIFACVAWFSLVAPAGSYAENGDDETTATPAVRAALPPELSAVGIPGADLRSRAAEAYAQGDFRTAIESWEQLREDGVVHPALYYNLGTAYAQIGDAGNATWMLLQAQRLAPRDPDIRENLERMNPDLYQQIAFFPIFPLEFLHRVFSLNEWALIAGAATFAAALFAVFALVRTRPGRWKTFCRRVGWIAAGLALFAHVFAGIKYWDQILNPSGVVISADTYPRAAPSENAEIYSFTLPAGTVVAIENAGQLGWVKAVYGGRNEVFLRTEQVRML